MTKKRKIIIGAAVAVIITGLTAMNTIKPKTAETVLLMAGTFQENIVEEGTVQPVSSAKIYAPYTGEVIGIEAQVGQYAKAGDILFELDTEDLKYQLKNLEAEKASLSGQQSSAAIQVTGDTVGIQKEAVNIAERNMNRFKEIYDQQKTLFETGAISAGALEDAKQAYDNAASTYKLEKFRLDDLKRKQGLDEGTSLYYASQEERIDNQIAEVKSKIEDAVVRAPQEGLISEFDFKQGDQLQSGQVAMEVMGDQNLEVEAYILARNSRNLIVGDTVEMQIETTYGYRDVKGSIKHISKNAVDVLSPLGISEKKVKVIIEPESIDGMILGEEIDVNFIMYENDNAISLNRDYSFELDGEDALWILENGTAKLMKVSAVYETGSHIIFEPSGEKALEVIITPYPDGIQEGMKLTTAK